jgi:hypothetical protein
MFLSTLARLTSPPLPSISVWRSSGKGLEPHLTLSKGCRSDQSAPASAMPLSVSLSTPVGDFSTLRGPVISRDPTATDTLVNLNCHGGIGLEGGWSRRYCDIGRLGQSVRFQSPSASGIPPEDGAPNPPKLTCDAPQPHPKPYRNRALVATFPIPKGSLRACFPYLQPLCCPKLDLFANLMS